MITYWVFYLFLSAIAIFRSNLNSNIIWILIGIVLTMFIGLRHEIGGDWPSYIRHYNEMQYYNIETIFSRGDPGYYLLNLFAYTFNLSIYFVNLVSGLIFSIGLILFAKKQINPWLVLTVAFPYLIIVVSMGYTRQAVAIGFIMWGLSYLNSKKRFYYLVFFIFLAATFHKSAVLVLGFVMFSEDKGRFFKYLSVLIIGIGMWTAFLSDYQDRLVQNYIEAEYHSSGALIRVVMNVLPALILLLFRNKWKQYFDDYNFWKIFAIVAFASLILVNFSSTAIDRIALYIIIIQLVVFSRLPILIGNLISYNISIIIVTIYYFLIQFVWLNFASHSHNWLPYQNFLFLDLW